MSKDTKEILFIIFLWFIGVIGLFFWSNRAYSEVVYNNDGFFLYGKPGKEIIFQTPEEEYYGMRLSDNSWITARSGDGSYCHIFDGIAIRNCSIEELSNLLNYFSIEKIMELKGL